MCVRRPASRSRSSRSIPIAPPRTAATTSRTRMSAVESVGSASSTDGVGGLLLRGGDLLHPAALLAATRLPLGPITRGGRQQRVLRGHPAAPLPGEPPRHALLDGRGAQDLRLALRPEHGAVRLLEEVGLDLERAKVVR